MALTFNSKLAIDYIIRVFQLEIFYSNVAVGDSSCDNVIIRKSCLVNLRGCELSRTL